MEKMDKAQEQAIMSALERTIGHINSGMTPTDALFKVAEAGQFTAPVVRRMAEALNVSRQLSHMKQAAGSSRAASFPLADAAVVLEKLYPSTLTSASEKLAAETVPGCYDRAETTNFLRPTRAKEALAFAGAKKASPYPVDPEHVAARVSKTRDRVRKEAAEAASVCRMTWDKLLAKAAMLADYFQRLEHEPFAQVEKKAYAAYGDNGLKVMDVVYGMGRLDEKRGSYATRPSAIFDSAREPYRQITELVALTEQLTAQTEKAADARIALEDFERKHAPAGDFDPQVETAGLTELLGGTTKAAFDPVTVAAMGGMQALGLKDPDSNSVRQQALSAVLDPAHESELQAAKVRAMLNDFASNDPILSAYDTPELMTAYNQLAQLAPATAQQPSVMRGMLRKVLQQGGVLEPFEAHQVSDIERKLRPATPAPEGERV